MTTGVEPQRAPLLALLGRLTGRPGDDQDDLLERCRESAGMRAEAGRFLAQFAERIRDLSVEERSELYDETLAIIVPSSVLGALGEALQRASQAPHAASDRLLIEHVLPAIERVLPLLETTRNPFALLLKSICFAVLDHLRAADSSGATGG
jgi:hypothetical protein